MADSNTGTRIAPPDAVPDDGDPTSLRRAKTRPTVIADNGQKCQRKRDAARKDRLTASAADRVTAEAAIRACSSQWILAGGRDRRLGGRGVVWSRRGT